MFTVMSDQFECDECGEQFDSKRGLSVHESQKHEETSNDKNTSDDRIEVSVGIKSIAAATFIFGVFVGLTGGLLASPALTDGETVLAEGGEAEQQPPSQEEQTTNGQQTATTEEIFQEAVERDDRPSIGDENAPVKIITYEDFFCLHCQDHNRDTVPQIMENHVEEGEVEYFYRHLPVVGGEEPAIASECVFNQNEDAFWDFKNYHYENSESLVNTYQQDQDEYRDRLTDFVSDQGLDSGEFRQCLDDRETVDAVQDDMQEAQEIGAEASPWNFVNGEPIRGAQNYQTFRQVIENELG